MLKSLSSTALVLVFIAGLGYAQTPPKPIPPLAPKPVEPRADTWAKKSFVVADLISPGKDTELMTSPDTAMVAARKAYQKVNAEKVAKLIATSVEPSTWANQGGVGTIKFQPDTSLLLVENDSATLDKVGELLGALRKLTNQQVILQLTICTVPSNDEAMKKLFQDTAVAMLSTEARDKQIHEWKERGVIEVLSRPQLVLLHNQVGFFQVGQNVPVPTGDANQPIATTPLGLTVRATPTVAPNKKDITVQMQVKCTELDRTVQQVPSAPKVNSLELDTKIQTVEGKCVAVKFGSSKRMNSVQSRVPVLSELPIVGDSFRFSTEEKQEIDYIVFVTAKPVTAPVLQATPMAPPNMPVGQVVPAAAVLPAQPAVASPLLKAYRDACAAGKPDEAARIAIQILAKDPTAFAKND